MPVRKRLILDQIESLDYVIQVIFVTVCMDLELQNVEMLSEISARLKQRLPAP